MFKIDYFTFDNIFMTNFNLINTIKMWYIKSPYADHILIPQGSAGSSTFLWYQMKPHIFLVANPKF